MKGEINHRAWAANALAFIAEKGLREEFRDWCGGWPSPFEPERSTEALRDHFAGAVTVSYADARVACDGGDLLDFKNPEDRAFIYRTAAKLRYEMADAMLAERAKGGGV